MAEPPRTIDVAIVGGGVSGCYCAYRFAHSSPSTRVSLFEMSDRIGGRLWSVSGVPGLPAELGGMFFSDHQKNVYGLITKELALDKLLVDWNRGHQFLRNHFLQDATYEQHPEAVPFYLATDEKGKNPAQLLVYALERVAPDLKRLWPMNQNSADASPRQTVAYLRALEYDGRPLCDWGFWNLLSNIVSNEAYDLLIATLGTLSAFRNSNAYDSMLTFLLELAPQEYFRLTAGYQQLPIELEARAASRVGFYREHRLTRVEPHDGALLSRFAGPDGKDVLVTAHSLILAMPSRALELIDFDDRLLSRRDLDPYLDAVLPVEASKLFLTFESPWWQAAVDGPGRLQSAEIAVAYTDLPMRQCYYYGQQAKDGEALLMTSYADGIAASFWWGFVDPDSRATVRSSASGGAQAFLQAPPAMVRSAHQQLVAMHKDETIPAPLRAIFFDWKQDPYGAAWHAWAPFVRSWEVMPRVRRPNSEFPVYICGEAFALPHGWVDGALNTAERVLEDYFELPRPSWVDKDYEFGYEF